MLTCCVGLLVLQTEVPNIIYNMSGGASGLLGVQFLSIFLNRTNEIYFRLSCSYF